MSATVEIATGIAQALSWAEESGQQPDGLDFTGVAYVWYQPAHRHEHLAICRGSITDPVPFTPNEEMSHSRWRDLTEPIANIAPIDAALAPLSPVE